MRRFLAILTAMPLLLVGFFTVGVEEVQAATPDCPGVTTGFTEVDVPIDLSFTIDPAAWDPWHNFSPSEWLPNGFFGPGNDQINQVFCSSSDVLAADVQVGQNGSSLTARLDDSGRVKLANVESLTFTTVIKNWSMGYKYATYTVHNSKWVEPSDVDSWMPDKNLQSAFLEALNSSENGNPNLGLAGVSEITKTNVEDVIYLLWDGTTNPIVDTTGIEYATSLRDIILPHNQISTIDFSSMPDLALIDLDNNSFTTAPNISNNPDVSRIDLTRNSLTSLPSDYFADADKLVSIYMGGNAITVFPDLSNPGIVENIVLAKNNLSNNFSQASSMVSLKELDLTENKIVGVFDVSAFTSLEILRINGGLEGSPAAGSNEITGFIGLEDATELRVIEAALNKLTEIPVFPVDNVLEELTLYNNQIDNTSVPQGVEDKEARTVLQKFPYLEEFSIYANALRGTISFENYTDAELAGIKHLSISYNRLSFVEEESLQKMTSLELFQYDGNFIRTNYVFGGATGLSQYYSTSKTVTLANNTFSAFGEKGLILGSYNQVGDPLSLPAELVRVTRKDSGNDVLNPPEITYSSSTGIFSVDVANTTDLSIYEIVLKIGDTYSITNQVMLVLQGEGNVSPIPIDNRSGKHRFEISKEEIGASYTPFNPCSGWTMESPSKPASCTEVYGITMTVMDASDFGGFSASDFGLAYTVNRNIYFEPNASGRQKLIMNDDVPVIIEMRDDATGATFKVSTKVYETIDAWMPSEDLQETVYNNLTQENVHYPQEWLKDDDNSQLFNNEVTLSGPEDLKKSLMDNLYVFSQAYGTGSVIEPINHDLSDLTGLEYATNLTGIYLETQPFMSGGNFSHVAYNQGLEFITVKGNLFDDSPTLIEDLVTVVDATNTIPNEVYDFQFFDRGLQGSNMKFFNLDNNAIGNVNTSTIPASLSWENSLREFSVSGNNLSGVLPSFSDYSKMMLFDVSNNVLTGDIQGPFGAMSDLEILEVNVNQFEGTIPSGVFSSKPNLTEVWANNNQFTGVLPASIGGSPALSVLSVHHNELTGKLGNNLLVGNKLATPGSRFYVDNNHFDSFSNDYESGMQVAEWADYNFNVNHLDTSLNARNVLLQTYEKEKIDISASQLDSEGYVLLPVSVLYQGRTNNDSTTVGSSLIYDKLEINGVDSGVIPGVSYLELVKDAPVNGVIENAWIKVDMKQLSLDGITENQTVTLSLEDIETSSVGFSALIDFTYNPVWSIPGISLEKGYLVDGVIASDVTIDSNFNITLRVMNTGDEGLSNIVITDSTLTGSSMSTVSCPQTSLSSGASMDCTGSLEWGMTVYHENEATVTAVGDISNASVNDSSSFIAKRTAYAPNVGGDGRTSIWWALALIAAGVTVGHGVKKKARKSA